MPDDRTDNRLSERLLGELCESAQNDRRPIDMPSALAGIEIAIATQEARIAELEGALKPFSDGVFNDNGDLTIRTHFEADDVQHAYFTLRALKDQPNV